MLDTTEQSAVQQKRRKNLFSLAQWVALFAVSLYGLCRVTIHWHNPGIDHRSGLALFSFLAALSAICIFNGLKVRRELHP
ncbi:MAG: hypothetical protein ABR971_12070 [Acidobacteriaceae bacterium]|jgi:hypothetical protein